jgi:hypothetical protein
MSNEELPDNPLFRWYERYIGEPQAQTDVYGGFGAFFAGIVCAVFGLGLFVLAVALYDIRTEPYFGLAKPAFILVMFALPLSLSGIVVLLPVERRATVSAGLGVLVSIVAIGRFYMVYPGQWQEYGIEQTLVVVGVYSGGLAIVTISTGIALIAQQLEHVRAPAPSEIEMQEEEPDPGESYSEAEIRADIDEAMEGVEMTWGGVEKSENKRLSFSGDFDTDVDRSGFDVEPDKRVETGGVDSQVTGLRQMKGGETKTATSNSTVDDQMAALQELKKQKAQDEVPDNAPTAEEGFLSKLLSRFRLN